MSIFGYEVLKASEMKKINKRINSLETDRQIRPFADFLSGYNQDERFVPFWAMGTGVVNVRDMYSISNLSSIYRQIKVMLHNEMFREGADWFNPDGKPILEDKVEDETLIKMEAFEKWTYKVNTNNQNIWDVFKEFEDDLQVTDNGYIIKQKEYFVDDVTGDITGDRLEQIFRVSPAIIYPIANEREELGYVGDKKAYVCLEHRSKIQFDIERCDDCGLQMLPAHYESFLYGGYGYTGYNFSTGGDTGGKIIYAEGEVIHETKYSTGLLGYPPYLTVHQKVLIELEMDRFVLKSYKEGKGPNSWTFLKTANPKSFEKIINFILDKVRLNPHYNLPIAVNTESTGEFVKHIDLMKPLTEMQAVEFRNVVKTEVGAFFGIMPLAQGDLSQGGGLNNEGLQFTVTNRAIESGQKIYNDSVFINLTKEFDIDPMHVVYRLNPSEEQDEMAELQRKSLQIDNALKMGQLGFDIDLDDDTQELLFSGEFDKESFQQGGFGAEAGAGFDTGTQASPSMGDVDRLSGSPESVSFAKGIRGDAIGIAKELDKELEDFAKSLGTGASASNKVLRKKVAGLVKTLKTSLLARTANEIKTLYQKGVEDIEKELGRNFVLSDADRNVISNLSNSRPLTKAYSGLDASLSKKLNAVITKAGKENLSVNDTVKAMREVVDLSDGRLRTIARTESANVSGIARMNAYKKADESREFVFTWKGPDDNRTSDFSKGMKRDVADMGGAVSDPVLRELVRKNAAPGFYTASRPYMTHPNQRHGPVRVVQLKKKSITKARNYLSPGEKAPKGASVVTGPKGGKYFDTSPTTGQSKEQKIPSGKRHENFKDNREGREKAIERKLTAGWKEQKANYKLLDTPKERHVVSGLNPKEQKELDTAWNDFKEKYPTDARRIKTLNVASGTLSTASALNMGNVTLSKEDMKTKDDIVHSLLHESYHLKTFLEKDSPEEWASAQNEFMAAAYPGNEKFEKIKEEEGL